MKYIRTKDKIYEVEDEIAAPNGEDEPLELFYKVVGKAELINSTRVVGKADTIEELCDDIVVIFPDGSKNTWDAHSNYNAKNFKDVYGIDILEEEIYYAIWTDKGLIYVAKMNEKGELDLI